MIPQQPDSHLFHSRCGQVLLGRDQWGVFASLMLKAGTYRLHVESGGCPNRILFTVRLEVAADGKERVFRLPQQIGSIDGLFVRLLRRKSRPAGQ